MIVLVDCNNFYASCERLFRPELQGRPVVVLSNNDGCVIARSNEAKALGIQMGAPAFMMEAFMLNHKVAVFSSNYTLYGSLSNRVMNMLKGFVQAVEVYSIDEAFLDVSGLINQNMFELAVKIREAVTYDVGIPVSIGIAPTKTLAKMANRYAKKECKESGVYVAEEQSQINQLLEYTSVGDVWGIGGQFNKKLMLNNVFTAADFVKMSEEWVRKNMTVVGLRMLNELKGISCIDWDDMPAPKKEICTAKSFGKLLSTKEDIREPLANYTNICAVKLRKQKSCAGVVHVFIQTNTHRTQDKQYFRSATVRLEVATCSSSELIKAAMKGLDIIYKPGYNFKKIGVILFDLIPENNIQMGLFDKADRERDKKLMRTFDKINERFGKNMVKYAAQGYNKQWKLRQEKLSPCYTTDIAQVLIIQDKNV